MKKSELKSLIKEVMDEMSQEPAPASNPQQPANEEQDIKTIMEPVVRDILTKMQKDDPENFKKILPYLQSEEKARELLNHPKVKESAEKVKKTQGVDWEEELDTLITGAKGLARGARDAISSEKGKKAIKFAGKAGKFAFVAFMRTVQMSIKTFGPLTTIIGLGFLYLLARAGPSIAGSLIEIMVQAGKAIFQAISEEENHNK